MSIWEIILVGAALAMDACAVSMTDGMTDKKLTVLKALAIGGLFGFFQFLMPLIGYYVTGVVAGAFLNTFEKISAWISFSVLLFLGGRTLIESIQEIRRSKRALVCPSPECIEERSKETYRLTVGALFLQAIATSIDALAVGVTLQMSVIDGGSLLGGAFGSTAVIGVVTFLLSFGAVYVGKFIGDKAKDKAGLLGGLVLIGIGVKTLIQSFL